MRGAELASLVLHRVLLCAALVTVVMLPLAAAGLWLDESRDRGLLLVTLGFLVRHRGMRRREVGVGPLVGGGILGWMVARGGSVWPAILAHNLGNTAIIAGSSLL